MIASGEITEPPKPKQAISERRVLKQMRSVCSTQIPNFETADFADLRSGGNNAHGRPPDAIFAG